ncbi:MAG: prepilin-type N-terminal cleavage/methylation domain-containing protein [Opitutaceae bacterium]|jgi:general secretion pathway protein G
MFRLPPRKTPRSATAHPHGAFTLIELLAVIAIIGVLVAILIPIVGSVRTSARASKCVSNLRQYSTAFQLYGNDNRGFYPAPRQPDANNPSANGNSSGGNWQLELAPYTSPKMVDGAVNFYRLKERDGEINIAYCPSYADFFSNVAEVQATNLNALGYGMNFNLNVGGATLNTSSGLVTRFCASLIVNPARSVLVGDSSDYHLDGKTSGWEVVPVSSTRPDGYNSGAPKRHRGRANYLFADGHVATLGPYEAIAILPFRL